MLKQLGLLAALAVAGSVLTSSAYPQGYGDDSKSGKYGQQGQKKHQGGGQSGGQSGGGYGGKQGGGDKQGGGYGGRDGGGDRGGRGGDVNGPSFYGSHHGHCVFHHGRRWCWHAQHRRWY